MSDARDFVNALRGFLGKKPLYGDEPVRGGGGYAKAQRLASLANPRCRRCEGAGYLASTGGGPFAEFAACPCTKKAEAISA